MKTAILSIKSNTLTFNILVFSIVAFVGLYMYFINAVVRNAVLRNKSESEVLVLENKISELEYKYMASNNSITPELAKSFGLVEPINKTFISRNLSGEPLSFNNR